jgi:hypothetical protein
MITYKIMQTQCEYVNKYMNVNVTNKYFVYHFHNSTLKSFKTF